MTKVLLIIMYISYNQGGITSQPIESIDVCRDLAIQLSGKSSIAAYCVESSK